MRTLLCRQSIGFLALIFLGASAYCLAQDLAQEASVKPSNSSNPSNPSKTKSSETPETPKILEAPEALATADAASAPTTSGSLVSKAYSLLESGDAVGALDYFSQALTEDASDLSARLGQAMIFADQQRHVEAFQTYDAIVKSHPRHAFAWNGRGLAAFNMENFDVALTSFKQATAEQPVNGFFYESLAWTQMCRGEFAEAALTAKQATLMYNKSRESSLYPLLIAYFAYLETDELSRAEATLKYALANRQIRQWPTPVIDYLADSITENELISFVTDTAQETEAHTYIGLKLRHAGKTEQAAKHLNWVSNHGDTRVFEYTLARSFESPNRVALLTP